MLNYKYPYLILLNDKTKINWDVNGDHSGKLYIRKGDDGKASDVLSSISGVVISVTEGSELIYGDDIFIKTSKKKWDPSTSKMMVTYFAYAIKDKKVIDFTQDQTKTFSESELGIIATMGVPVERLQWKSGKPNSNAVIKMLLDISDKRGIKSLCLNSLKFPSVVELDNLLVTEGMNYKTMLGVLKPSYYKLAGEELTISTTLLEDRYKYQYKLGRGKVDLKDYANEKYYDPLLPEGFSSMPITKYTNPFEGLVIP